MERESTEITLNVIVRLMTDIGYATILLLRSLDLTISYVFYMLCVFLLLQFCRVRGCFLSNGDLLIKLDAPQLLRVPRK